MTTAIESLKLKDRKMIERKMELGEIKFSQKLNAFVHTDDENKQVELRGKGDKDDDYGDESDEDMDGSADQIKQNDDAMDFDEQIQQNSGADAKVEKPEEEKLPVTILSGLKGSGKSSLLKQVFSNQNGLRCAVIVDEIDYEWFATSFPEDDLTIEEEFVRFKNGCFCCESGDELT